MEKKLKIYLDTSVINFLFADDAPEKKEVTIDFFDNFIKKFYYNTYISAFVIEEINATKEDYKRNLLLNVVKQYPINFVEKQDLIDIQELADIYIDSKIIPSRNYMDAYHIALCIINDIDFLVSWNYKHLANVHKEKLIRIVNLQNNYNNELRIITPMEMIDYGNDDI